MGVYDALFRVSACDANGRIQINKGTGPLEFIADNKHRLLNVALDQSTVQIGVCITDAETDELLGVADVCNLGFPKTFDFKQYFLEFIKHNLFDARINIFFYEIPVEHGEDLHVRKVLNALRSFISDFPRYVPSLEDAKMVEINNRTWKTHFLASDIYTGRKSKTKDVKQSAMEETIVRFPNLQMYCQSFSKPPDSCDAVGIMYGGLAEIRATFDPAFQRINRTMEQSTGAKYSTDCFISSFPELYDAVQSHSDFKQEHYGWEVVEYNPKMSLKENCSRWVSGHNRVAYCIARDTKSMQILKWEFGVAPPRDNQHFYVLRISRNTPVAGLK